MQINNIEKINAIIFGLQISFPVLLKYKISSLY